MHDHSLTDSFHLSALCWIADTPGAYEVVINGLRRGVPPKHRQNPKFRSDISTSFLNTSCSDHCVGQFCPRSYFSTCISVSLTWPACRGTRTFRNMFVILSGWRIQPGVVLTWKPNFLLKIIRQRSQSYGKQTALSRDGWRQASSGTILTLMELHVIWVDPARWQEWVRVRVQRRFVLPINLQRGITSFATG